MSLKISDILNVFLIMFFVNIMTILVDQPIFLLFNNHSSYETADAALDSQPYRLRKLFLNSTHLVRGLKRSIN